MGLLVNLTPLGYLLFCSSSLIHRVLSWSLVWWPCPFSPFPRKGHQFLFYLAFCHPDNSVCRFPFIYVIGNFFSFVEMFVFQGEAARDGDQRPDATQHEQEGRHPSDGLQFPHGARQGLLRKGELGCMISGNNIHHVPPGTVIRQKTTLLLFYFFNFIGNRIMVFCSFVCCAFQFVSINDHEEKKGIERWSSSNAWA